MLRIRCEDLSECASAPHAVQLLLPLNPFPSLQLLLLTQSVQLAQLVQPLQSLQLVQLRLPLPLVFGAIAVTLAGGTSDTRRAHPST